MDSNSNNNNNNNDEDVDMGGGGDDDDAVPKIKYRECLKNHAVTIGGHAVDGCGEFLPSSSSASPLLCAACGCHRNFHRRDDTIQYSSSPVLAPPHHQYYHRAAAAAAAGYSYNYNQQFVRGPAPPHLALPSTSGGGAHSGGRGMTTTTTTDEEDMSAGGAKRKRFRTKFTAEQKERMVGLAERVGWRIQKQDEEAVQEFCNETGIKRHVFKVWMHNNKHTLGGKKP